MSEVPAHSLQSRLLRRLLLATSLVVGVSASFSYVLASHFADRVFDAWLSDTAGSLANVVASRADFNDAALNEAVERQVRFDATDWVAFTVRGPQGLLSGRGDIPEPQHPQPRKGLQLYDARMEDHPIRVARQVLERDGQLYTVAVAETIRKRHVIATQLLFAALLPSLLLVGVAAALIRSGVRRALQPLDAISDAIARSDPQNLQPLPAGELAEIRPLTAAINDLLARLNLALDAQRSFVADTAHQLRNPLAGIKLQIEEALRHTEPVSRETLRRVLGGVDRAARLAAQLLALARAEADATQAQMPLEAVDLEQFAAERGREWVPQLLRRHMQIQLDPPAQSVLALCRPLLLGEALDNLLDNALRYAGQGCTVRLIIAGNEEEAWLTVADDGPGFAPNQQDTLFRRFARGDHSSGDGAGLGMAIVRELLRAQNGEAEVVAAPGGRGAAIRLRLRRAGAGASTA